MIVCSVQLPQVVIATNIYNMGFALCPSAVSSKSLKVLCRGRARTQISCNRLGASSAMGLDLLWAGVHFVDNQHLAPLCKYPSLSQLRCTWFISVLGTLPKERAEAPKQCRSLQIWLGTSLSLCIFTAAQTSVCLPSYCHRKASDRCDSDCGNPPGMHTVMGRIQFPPWQVGSSFNRILQYSLPWQSRV